MDDMRDGNEPTNTMALWEGTRVRSCLSTYLGSCSNHTFHAQGLRRSLTLATVLRNLKHQLNADRADAACRSIPIQPSYVPRGEPDCR
ncbi:hypothetical protein HBI56_084850 [Parastagonospora nodorum]|uniref:Uncharacterized protein n=1 Tax=Phaeosphaeria nodorum (strain SN15 / ATCC MYA-4574 / FGSC 10173) TaxID=321614 RepID=A0A7U2I876_PHANO|nr:hypothetical protein HBH56_101710 [Parastagonospora nodorum]QRD04462.1 hypothetical protein JI435_421200 [Parastagonospora nodorum SN15]KAH3929175.1 hypothetical protein HBH54_128720 [Parastagonospora nodorum]KAH3951501.1 hypothetical protein HBH53_062710 [Parastagonospora nodorum]KAH4032612.1 hypothetical protein HBI09_121110 [Parastagonospora nodorum]